MELEIDLKTSPFRLVLKAISVFGYAAAASMGHKYK